MIIYISVFEKYLVFKKCLINKDSKTYTEQNQISNQEDNMLTICSLLAPPKLAIQKQKRPDPHPKAALGNSSFRQWANQESRAPLGLRGTN